jgi:hypothetical protein
MTLNTFWTTAYLTYIACRFRISLDNSAVLFTKSSTYKHKKCQYHFLDSSVKFLKDFGKKHTSENPLGIWEKWLSIIIFSSRKILFFTFYPNFLKYIFSLRLQLHITDHRQYRRLSVLQIANQFVQMTLVQMYRERDHQYTQTIVVHHQMCHRLAANRVVVILPDKSIIN